MNCCNNSIIYLKGDRGDPGMPGYTGPNGATGATGPTGATGSPITSTFLYSATLQTVINLVPGQFVPFNNNYANSSQIPSVNTGFIYNSMTGGNFGIFSVSNSGYYSISWSIYVNSITGCTSGCTSGLFGIQTSTNGGSSFQTVNVSQYGVSNIANFPSYINGTYILQLTGNETLFTINNISNYTINIGSSSLTTAASIKIIRIA
jgi:hypothetical protein